MSFHRNAKLGLAGRLALVRSIEEGLTLVAPLAGRGRGAAGEATVS